jgi:hypothetical protein
VHTRFRSGPRVDIRASDDPIRRNEDVAVEKVLLRRAFAYVCFPLDPPGRGVEAAEEPVARSEVQAIAHDRGRVGESPSGFELPKDFRLLRLGVGRRHQQCQEA